MDYLIQFRELCLHLKSNNANEIKYPWNINHGKSYFGNRQMPLTLCFIAEYLSQAYKKYVIQEIC